ncbi:MAG: hypothetical protein CMH12_12960 [Maritimibacter sp.]|nr:hypothetical protein [Maritimibacter sp.]
MKIEPGVYALHRAAQTEVSATEFRDDDRGLTVSVGTPADTADKPRVVIVLAGRVTADGLGAFGPGQAMILPASAALSAEAGTACVTLTADATDGPGQPMALRPDTLGEIPPCDPTPADLLLSGTPEQTDLTLYKDAARNFGAGVWTTTAYHRRSIAFPKFEVMHMLSGWIELTEDSGTVHRFETGDTFLISKDTRCDWNTGGMEKIFCTLTPT